MFMLVNNSLNNRCKKLCTLMLNCKQLPCKSSSNDNQISYMYIVYIILKNNFYLHIEVFFGTFFRLHILYCLLYHFHSASHFVHYFSPVLSNVRVTALLSVISKRCDDNEASHIANIQFTYNITCIHVSYNMRHIFTHF